MRRKTFYENQYTKMAAWLHITYFIARLYASKCSIHVNVKSVKIGQNDVVPTTDSKIGPTDDRCWTMEDARSTTCQEEQ